MHQSGAHQAQVFKQKLQNPKNIKFKSSKYKIRLSGVSNVSPSPNLLTQFEEF